MGALPVSVCEQRIWFGRPADCSVTESYHAYTRAAVLAACAWTTKASALATCV